MSKSVSFFPTRDDALLAWSLNFKTLITATPTTYGLTSGQATAYGALHTAFATALAACDPASRTKPAVVTKNAARTNLKASAKLLANLVNGTSTVTDAQKVELGLNVRRPPTHIPAPASAPGLEVKSVSGWTVAIRLNDTASGATRGKPPGVNGASLFSFVGPTPPAEISAWKFEGNVGRPAKVAVAFDSSLAAGTKVWLTAFWFNGRKQSGPACDPVSTNLQGGGVSTLAA